MCFFVERTGLRNFFSLVLIILFSQHVHAGDVDWNRWSLHNPDSKDEVQYGPYDTILRTLVDDSSGIPMIRYSVLSPLEPMKYVTRYAEYLESIPVSKLNRDEQFAYWINLHNLGVIQLYATESGTSRNVKEARGTPGAPGEQWSKKIFEVEGQLLSLEDIEQNILLAQWHDPHTLYGLCYGVKGSPPIGTHAFTGSKVHEQLASIGKDFVNTPGNVNVKKNGLEVSSLYTWNKYLLFNDEDAQVIRHIQSLAKPTLANKMSGKTTILRDRFSWRSLATNPRTLSTGSSLGARGGGTTGS